MLNVLGLVINFFGTVVLSLNLVFASDEETAGRFVAKTVGLSSINAGFSERLNARIGLSMLAIGFAFQFAQEFTQLRVIWWIIWLFISMNIIGVGWLLLRSKRSRKGKNRAKVR